MMIVKDSALVKATFVVTYLQQTIRVSTEGPVPVCSLLSHHGKVFDNLKDLPAAFALAEFLYHRDLTI